MKIHIGLMAAAAMIAFAPAAVAQKGVPNSYGYVKHQKTGGNHPGGHSSVTGHKKNAGTYSSGYTGASGGGHTHTPGCGHYTPKPEPKKRCFPPGHCKSINQGYYGPPGQR